MTDEIGYGKKREMVGKTVFCDDKKCEQRRFPHMAHAGKPAPNTETDGDE